MIDNICDNIYFKIIKSEENNPSIEGIIKENSTVGAQIYAPKSLVEIFKRKKHLVLKIKLVIAKYIKDIFPTSQRSSSWLKNFDIL